MAASASIPLEELFDADFLAAVQRLRLVARRVPAGGRWAEQRSRALGQGHEFRDFRAYVAGDELRTIDWNLYRRLGRVFVRLFEEPLDLPVYLLPDVSDSMFQERAPRARAALRATLALGAIALGEHDTVRLLPFARGLDAKLPPFGGRDALLGLARRLAALAPAGPTELGPSLARFEALGLRSGLAVVVSDFFDPAGLEGAFEVLRRSRHRIVLVQIARASDREPEVEGELRLVDCESGRAEDVAVTPRVLQRYREAHARFEARLAQIARELRAGFLRLDAERELVPQLAALFESGSYVA